MQATRMNGDTFGWIILPDQMQARILLVYSMYYSTVRVQCAVGWCELALFTIFKTNTFLSIRYIFKKEFNSKKSAISTAGA